jgi:hypothetical protein
MAQIAAKPTFNQKSVLQRQRRLSGGSAGSATAFWRKIFTGCVWPIAEKSVATISHKIPDDGKRQCCAEMSSSALKSR